MLTTTTATLDPVPALALAAVPAADPRPQPGARVAPPVEGPRKASRVLIRQRRGPATAAPDWVLEFEPSAEAFAMPLMGWLGVRAPIGGDQLAFVSATDALAYAQRHGWSAEIIAPQPSWTPRSSPVT